MFEISKVYEILLQRNKIGIIKSEFVVCNLYVKKITSEGHEYWCFEVKRIGLKFAQRDCARLLQNSLEIIACNEEDAITIAKFRVLTKSAGLSLGDRACLALGKRLNLPVLTADKVWTSLSLGITITLIR